MIRLVSSGAPYCAVQENRVATLQSLSGTGSLRVAAEFIAKFLPGKTAYLSNPTWGNHKVRAIALAAAFRVAPVHQESTDSAAADQQTPVILEGHVQPLGAPPAHRCGMPGE